MEKFTCKMCNKYMGEMEKGKIRNNAIILCGACWEKAKIAVDMAELARNQARSASSGQVPLGKIQRNNQIIKLCDICMRIMEQRVL